MSISSRALTMTLDALLPQPGEQIALFNPPATDPAIMAAQQGAQVSIYGTSHSALVNLRQRLAGYERIHISDDIMPAADSGLDALLLFCPKGRDLARALLWHTAQALRPGGRLIIAGANEAGVKSVIADAGALLGGAITLGYKDRHRVGRAMRPAALVSPPDDWRHPTLEPQPLTLKTPQGMMTVCTMPGVFSWQGLDDGTRFLLENLDFAHLSAESSVLDMGCGYGIIGMIAAHFAGAVRMVDDDLLAVRSAQCSAALNQLDRVAITAGDVYDELAGQRFDWIISNPPFHRGVAVQTDVARRIISGAGAHLKPGGRLVLVANTFLPYRPLFEQYFAQVTILAQGKRYSLIEGR
jgi:16S rRNA (guanine1207-N2)-methyltransferase